MLPHLRIALIFAIAAQSVGARPRQHQRRSMRSSPPCTSSSSSATTCAEECDAQFKADYQINFGVFYENGYFDIPMDQRVVANAPARQTFCALVDARTDCRTKDCRAPANITVAEKQFCRHKKIRDNLKCLSKVATDVSEGCSDTCLNLKLAPSPEEKLTELSREQHDTCVFYQCHRVCQTALIEKKCEAAEREPAQRAVAAYYDAYMTDDAEDSDSLPSFCRRVTPGRREDAGPRIHAANSKTMRKLHEAVRNFVDSRNN